MRMTLLSVPLFVSLGGCLALHEAGVPWAGAFVDFESPRREEQAWREKYQSSRDAEAFNWLFQNRVGSGMSVGEVNETLGENGQRVLDDTWIKTSGGPFRSGDEAYRWGPDENGRSVYLVFRNDHLVDFHPESFAE